MIANKLIIRALAGHIKELRKDLEDLEKLLVEALDEVRFIETNYKEAL